MTAILTPFASQPGRYSFMGSMSLENAYLEQQSEGGKARYVILPSAGLVQHAADIGTPGRGMIFMEDLDFIYSFHSSSVWKVTENGTETRIGTVPGIDRVQVTRNKKTTPQVTLLTSAALYYIENDEVRLINTSAFPAAIVSIETLGEYTLYGLENGRIVYSTQGETSIIDQVDFFTAEQSADELKRLKVDRGELFAFGAGQTTEVFSLTATNPDEPFTFRTVIPKGLLARDSVVSADGTLMFISHDRIFGRLDGYTFRRISDHEVERLIQSDTAPEDILAFSWSQHGHTFVTLKGTNWTRTYDTLTGFWHSRKSVGLDVWRAQFAVTATTWNRSILQDQLTGKLLYLDPSIYTEDGGAMLWTVITPFLHAFPNGGILDRLSVDFLTGQGVTVSTAQGFDPLLMVSKSVDGGNTFSSPRHLSMGRQGRYDTRINSHRWGRFRQKGAAFKISVSDPVGRGLALMDAKVRPLAV